MKKLFTQPPGALRSCLPDERQHRLLTVCLALSAEEALAAWEHWIGEVDVETLDPASNRLLPLAYLRLNALGVRHREMPRLGGVLRHAWARNLTQRHRLEPVLRLFAAHGIEHVLLKGAPLAFSVYPNPGARPMDDVDVLVPLSRAREAMRLLIEAGGEFLENPVPPRGSSADDPDPLLFKHGVAIGTAQELSLDLHWFALADGCVPGLDDGFWARRRPLPALGNAWQLAPEDNFLHLCVHGLRAGPVSSVRWIADAVFTLRAAGPDFDWVLLLDETRRRRLVAPVRHALIYIAENFDAPIPPEVLASWRAEPVGLFERVAHQGNVSANLFTQFAATWLRYRRTAAGRRGWLRRWAGFPTYLRHSWGHVGYRRVVWHILRRSVRRGRVEA
jgi:hypothetical protein